MIISIFVLKLIILLVSVIFNSLYIFSWIKFQKYQFLERDYNIVGRYPGYSRQWHFYKGLNQVLFFVIMVPFFGIPLVLFNMVYYWIMFDGFFNRTVLKKSFLYVGSTARLDKNIREIASHIKFLTPERLALLLKILLSVAFLNLYF